MGCIVSAFRRPRVLPEIIVALTWVSPVDIVSLVEATETLEFKRLKSANAVTAQAAANATTSPSADETEEKDADLIAEQYPQGHIYHIQTKKLNRPVNYTSRICLVVLATGLQVRVPTLIVMGPGALNPQVSAVLMLRTPVLPRGLLQKITIIDNSSLSATQSLGYLLAGVDQFADWESSYRELLFWWLLLLRPYWRFIVLGLVFVPLIILIAAAG
ncbi:unnamed protein product [Penicillium glandicola]